MKSKAQVPTIFQGLQPWMMQQLLSSVSIGGGLRASSKQGGPTSHLVLSGLSGVGGAWLEAAKAQVPGLNSCLSVCRTPCPVTMPHPCAAQWITNPPHPRRRRWQKWLRRKTSLRSVSLKVRDRAGLETLWTGGGGATANQFLQCRGSQAP